MHHIRPIMRAAAILLVLLGVLPVSALARSLSLQIPNNAYGLAARQARPANASPRFSDNQNPVAADDWISAIRYGSTNNVLRVLDNDSDPDGDALSIVSVSTDEWAGTLVISGTTLIYTPRLVDAGNHSEVYYTISDGRGGTAEGFVDISVWPRLARPRNDYYRIPSGCVDCLLDVMSNDSGGEYDHRVEVGLVAPPRHGAARPGYSEYGATHVLYTPKDGYTGADVFTYALKQSYGASATVGVTVAGIGENAAPIALDDAPVVGANTLATDLEVLGNDRDLDGVGLSITAVGMVRHGALSNLGHTLVYTPTANFAGTDSFTYTVSDAGGLSSTALVNVAVGPAPTLWPGFLALPSGPLVAGQPYSATLHAGDGDAGVPLAFGSTGLPAGLSLVDHGDRTATLSGIPSQAGAYTPTISISDPHMTTSVSLPLRVESAPLTITSPPPAPATYGGAYSHTLAATGIDPTAPITFSLTIGALPPGLSLDDSGVLSGTPTAAGSYPDVGLTAHSADGSYTQLVTLTIARAPLTITADDLARPLGQPNPPLTARFSGFVLSDDASVFSSPLALSTAATPASPVGGYAITPGGATAANYAITFVPGTLTITNATLFLPLVAR
jgi:large repetitive protein